MFGNRGEMLKHSVITEDTSASSVVEMIVEIRCMHLIRNSHFFPISLKIYKSTGVMMTVLGQKHF